MPAGLLALHRRGTSTAALAGLAALAIAVVAIGYPVERDYLRDRFLNDGPRDERIPGMHLDSAYRWARDIEGARIGLAGTTAGFLQYGFFGTDLSNRVVYLGEKGPHGAFDAIPTCRGFRAAVNAADLDYLVTSPFLNFIDTEAPIASPEAGWLRGRARGPADRAQRAGDRMESRGPPRPRRLQGSRERAAAPSAPAARRLDRDRPRPGYSSESESVLSEAAAGRLITI